MCFVSTETLNLYPLSKLRRYIRPGWAYQMAWLEMLSLWLETTAIVDCGQTSMKLDSGHRTFRRYPMYKLHYYPANANAAPHMLLEELGQKFELSIVERSKNAQKSEAYLKINPN